MIQLRYSSLLIAFLLFSCNMQLTSKKVIKNDIEMLYGPVSIQQLYYDYPEWKEIEIAYEPDTDMLQKLSELEGRVDVKIFLATWCSDSRREVPRFLKIIKRAKLTDRVNVEMWAVDRKLKISDNLAEQNNIEKVATFIFFRQGKEIGRIVESPDTLLLEEHVLSILIQS